MAKKSKKRREAERRRLERELAAAQAQGPEAEAVRLARAKAKAEHEAERLRRKAQREGRGAGLNPLYVGLPVAAAAVAGVIVLVVVLAGGGGGGGDGSAATVTPDPRLGGATPAATFTVDAIGEEEGSIFVPDTLTIPAGQVVEIVVQNKATRVSHNLRVSGDDGKYETEGLNLPKDDWLLPLVKAGETGKLLLKMDTPGSYKFQCDFHPQTQKGTLIVQ